MANEIMLGGDYSHHQYLNGKPKLNPSHLNFVILKATEGTSYKDDKMDAFLQLMVDTRGETGAPFIGFYHYARAEKNSPLQEAQHFLDVVEPHLGNCFLALDYEGDALKVPTRDRWACEFLDYVTMHNGGVKPLLYTSGAYTKDFPTVASQGYPLWVAHYNTLAPKVTNWTAPTIWQFTSKPYDMNIFYGSPSDMVRLITGK